MPQYTYKQPGMILTYSSNDAIFRKLDCTPIAMEYHKFLGPFFSLTYDDGGWLPEVDTPEWDHLWNQFDGWWEAKGKHLYKVC
jgi:hypothetical protein